MLRWITECIVIFIFSVNLFFILRNILNTCIYYSNHIIYLRLTHWSNSLICLIWQVHCMDKARNIYFTVHLINIYIDYIYALPYKKVLPGNILQLLMTWNWIIINITPVQVFCSYVCVNSYWGYVDFLTAHSKHSTDELVLAASCSKLVLLMC